MYFTVQRRSFFNIIINNNDDDDHDVDMMIDNTLIRCDLAGIVLCLAGIPKE